MKRFLRSWCQVGKCFFENEVIGEALWRELSGLVEVDSELFGEKKWWR